MEQPQRILVRSPNWLGDHIMALACYHGVRQLFPKSYIVGWVPAGFKGVIPSGLFDEEWEFKKSDLKDRKGVAHWLKKIQEANFDLSINLNASWSSALLFFRAKIPHRVSFSESGSQILSSASLPFRGVKAGIHKSQIYWKLLLLVDQKLTFQPAYSTQMSTERKTEKFWVIAPGAALPLREWPYFPELIFELKKRYPDRILKVVGTVTESAWKSRLARWKLKGVEDLIGETNLLDLKNICSQSELVIANDSGVAHLSATLSGARTLVLFGPGNPAYIAPHGSQVIPVRVESGIRCSPCEKSYCRAPEGYQKCLKEISIESVLQQIESALSL